MNSKQRNIKPLIGAMCLALGASCMHGSLQAEVITLSFGSGVSMPIDGSSPYVNDGLMTILTPSGGDFSNSSLPYYYDTTWGYGKRTQISGSFTIDTNTLNGNGTVLPFSFFRDGNPAVIHDLILSNAGIDSKTGHQMVLGKMFLDWNGTNNIPVEVVWDMSGLLTVLSAGVSIGDIITGGAIPSSEPVRKFTIPIGPAPVATTTWNTDATGNLPLIDDGIGGSPMRDGPFLDFNMNLDMTRLIVSTGGTTTVLINSVEGTMPECTSFNGSDVNYTATVIGMDLYSAVEWRVDGAWVADGDQAAFNVPLGAHTVMATVFIDNGDIISDSENVVVSDTVAPVISAQLINSKTGDPVATVVDGESVNIQMSATDVCDANPVVSGTGGFAVENNDKFTANVTTVKKRKAGTTTISVSAEADQLNFSIMSKDASNNMSSENLTLDVIVP